MSVTQKVGHMWVELGLYQLYVHTVWDEICGLDSGTHVWDAKSLSYSTLLYEDLLKYTAALNDAFTEQVI